MSMDLSPADYMVSALPTSSIEFPMITFSLIGVTCMVLAYATAFSEDADGAADSDEGGIDFSNFGLKDLGFSDEPRDGGKVGVAKADSADDDAYGFELDDGRERRAGGRAGKKSVSRRNRRSRSRRRGGA